MAIDSCSWLAIKLWGRQPLRKGNRHGWPSVIPSASHVHFLENDDIQGCRRATTIDFLPLCSVVLLEKILDLWIAISDHEPYPVTVQECLPLNSALSVWHWRSGP